LIVVQIMLVRNCAHIDFIYFVIMVDLFIIIKVFDVRGRLKLLKLSCNISDSFNVSRYRECINNLTSQMFISL
jgi:hypothetical protein